MLEMKKLMDREVGQEQIYVYSNFVRVELGISKGLLIYPTEADCVLHGLSPIKTGATKVRPRSRSIRNMTCFGFSNSHLAERA